MSKVFEALERARREQRVADVPERLVSATRGTTSRYPEGSASEAHQGLLSSREDTSIANSRQMREPKSRGEEDDRRPKSLSERILSWNEVLGRSLGTTDPRSIPDLVIEDGRADTAAEQFHALRANLERCNAQREGTVLLVTSALAGEGKSFVCLNLAATLAISGTRVILIDADLRRPTLHRALNLVALSGLKSYLEGESDFASTLHRTSIDLLSVIPTGGQLCSPSFLLGGRKMLDLINKARALTPPYLIIVDTPAALVCSDAQILSRFADGILFVVAANASPRATVREALQMFGDAKIHGVILNRFEYSYSAARQLGYRSKYAGQEIALDNQNV